MQVNSSNSANYSMAVTKKVINSTREQGQQALSLIQSASSNTGNAPRKTSGVHIVA